MFNVKQQILDALLDLKKNGTEYKGICAHIENWVLKGTGERIRNTEYWDMCDEVNNTLEAIFITWPKFSGSILYPVPHPDAKVRAFYTNPNRSAYLAFALPSWEGEYGELRWELVDHIINFIEKEIENAENAEAAERST